MKQKGFLNFVLIAVVIILVGVVGYFEFVKKSGPIVSQPFSMQDVVSDGHLVEFEEAVNKSDFSSASKYFADKVYVVIEESSCCGADEIYGKSPCCGDVPASRAEKELEKIRGLIFTFNQSDFAVKEYLNYMATEYPNRRFIKTTPNKLYFDELVIGVESDGSQQNRASIGYKIYNDKITDLFINIGRSR